MLLRRRHVSSSRADGGLRRRAIDDLSSFSRRSRCMLDLSSATPVSMPGELLYDHLRPAGPPLDTRRVSQPQFYAAVDRPADLGGREHAQLAGGRAADLPPDWLGAECGPDTDRRGPA